MAPLRTAAESMERTLILLKPDALQRGLAGRILARFEEKGLKLCGMKLMQIRPELAATHYQAHAQKGFYKGLVRFMTSRPVVAIALEGIDAIKICRAMMGATFGADAAPGTIRGDFGVSRSYNLIHGSDSKEAAERELALFFPEGLVEYTLDAEEWVYDPVEELKRG
jgi:nucleoside-diphosphate kinase